MLDCNQPDNVVEKQLSFVVADLESDFLLLLDEILSPLLNGSMLVDDVDYIGFARNLVNMRSQHSNQTGYFLRIAERTQQYAIYDKARQRRILWMVVQEMNYA